MRFLSSEAVRALDRAAIARGVPGAVLMQLAGVAVAREVARLARARGTRTVTFALGRGNNGGDGCVAAAELQAAGFRVAVRLAARPADLTGDARLAWDRMAQAGVAWEAWACPADWDGAEIALFPFEGIVVDGLLGTGSRGAPRDAIAAAIRWINRLAPRCAVVAIDLPSGLDADSGCAAGALVRADLTVCLAAPKTGFGHPPAAACLGHVEIADIGLPVPSADEAQPQEFLAASELAARLRRRSHAAHKGNCGHVLVLGGAAGFSGAPALTAAGALRAGAGLVSAAVPACAQAALASLAPEAMAHVLAAPGGFLSPDAVRRWSRSLADFDVTVAGPGLTVRPETRTLVRDLLALRLDRLLLDADGLNVLAGWAGSQPMELPAVAPGGVILTPHPGEAARLLGVAIAEVQADRCGAVRRIADRTGAVVVLKGAGTLVCTPGGTPELNLTGNAGMATGGTGDVLAGVIAGLWAGGLNARDAAAVGVYLHGTAGDLAAWHGAPEALVAHDLLASLGEALRGLRAAGAGGSGT